MKEIKTKPAGGQPRTLDKGGVVPKTAMKEMWLHTKDKTLSETMETPFASQQEATGNAPANIAGDQMLSSAETTAKKGAEMAYDGGKKMIRIASSRRNSIECPFFCNGYVLSQVPSTSISRACTSTF